MYRLFIFILNKIMNKYKSYINKLIKVDGNNLIYLYKYILKCKYEYITSYRKGI